MRRTIRVAPNFGRLLVASGAVVLLLAPLGPVQRVAHAAPPAKAGAARPAVGRSEQTILAELERASGEMRGYPHSFFVDRKYLHQFVPMLTPVYQRRVALLSELEKLNTPRKAQYAFMKNADLAVLSYYERANPRPPGDGAAVPVGEASKALETAAGSKTPAEAAAAKVALLMRDWWLDQTSEAQRKVLEQFRTLAKASPADDTLTMALLKVTSMGAADEDVANAARDLVEQGLKGPMAPRTRPSPTRWGGRW